MDRLSTGKSLSTLKSNNSKYKMYYDSIFASIPYLEFIVKKNGKKFARIFWDEFQFYQENLKPLIQQDLRISQTHSAWNQFSLHVDKLAQIT